MNNKDLLYSTGNYIQYLSVAYKGKESEIYVCVCVYICMCVYVCVCVYIYIYIYI